MKKLGRSCLCAGLFLLVALKGSAIPIALLAACLPIGLATAIACAFPPTKPVLARSFYLCLILIAALAGYILWQASSWPGSAFNHPIWADANRLLGGHSGAASVNPEATRLALFTLVPPFLLYAATLALFDSSRAAQRLIAWLGILGTAFACFGLLQVSLLPRSLLFFEKSAYIDNVTSVFVNRNTAGTFLGVSSLVVLTWFFLTISQGGSRRPLYALVQGEMPKATRNRAVAILIALIITLLALFLTISRGALLSTVAAYVIIVAPLLSALRNSDGDLTARRPRDIRRWVTSGLFIVGILFVAIFFGAQALFRLERQSVDIDRLCVYAATWIASQHNWLFGTGFGTFQDVFPSYRLPDCGSIYAAFDRAHNFYLEGLLGLGVVFVPLLILLYGHVTANLYAGYRSRHRLRFVPVLAFGAVLLVSLHSLVDFSLQIPGMAGFFAVYLGATTVICLSRVTSRDERVRARDQVPQHYIAK